MAFTKKQKLDLHNQLENSLLDLQNLGWPINKIELLKKHFGFYVGLVNGYIEPKDSVHQDFIKKIKNWKTSVPKNIHEEIYINYIKYNSNKNLQISNNKDLIPEWMLPPPGSRQYPTHFLEKLEEEFEEQTWDDWFADWKYR